MGNFVNVTISPVKDTKGCCAVEMESAIAVNVNANPDGWAIIAHAEIPQTLAMHLMAMEKFVLEMESVFAGNVSVSL